MRLKKVTQNDPVERLAVSVKSSTLELIEAYRLHYKASYGEEIERSHLVEEILREFINSDRDFTKTTAPAEVPAKVPAKKQA